MSLGAGLSGTVTPLVEPPMANMGQTKGGSPTHHEDHTIKVVYVARSCWGLTLEPGLWQAPGSAHGTDRVQPGMALRAQLPVGSPPGVRIQRFLLCFSRFFLLSVAGRSETPPASPAAHLG